MHTHTLDAMLDTRDAYAMSPAMLDPYRAATTLMFRERVIIAGDAEAELDALDATVALSGPRGAQEFARIYARAVVDGDGATMRPYLSIRLDKPTAAARQMRAILRWLLACNGHGEDTLQDVILATLERGGEANVGTVMLMTPEVLMAQAAEREHERAMRDSTPIEWLD